MNRREFLKAAGQVVAVATLTPFLPRAQTSTVLEVSGNEYMRGEFAPFHRPLSPQLQHPVSQSEWLLGQLGYKQYSVLLGDTTT